MRRIRDDRAERHLLPAEAGARKLFVQAVEDAFGKVLAAETKVVAAAAGRGETGKKPAG